MKSSTGGLEFHRLLWLSLVQFTCCSVVAQKQVAAGPDRITALIMPCLIVMASYASTNHVIPAQLHRQRRQRDGRVSLLQDSSRILNMQDALQISFIITMSANIKYIYTQPLHPHNNHSAVYILCWGEFSVSSDHFTDDNIAHLDCRDSRYIKKKISMFPFTSSSAPVVHQYHSEWHNITSMNSCWMGCNERHSWSPEHVLNLDWLSLILLWCLKIYGGSVSWSLSESSQYKF